MAFARLYISKFSRGRMPPDSPYDTRPGRESGKLTSAPPPKFRGPYAYVHFNNGRIVLSKCGFGTTARNKHTF